MAPALASMPPDVLNHVVKYFNCKEVLNFRLVCKYFKSYVDIGKPDLGFKYLNIIVITGGFLIHFGTDTEELRTKNYFKTVMSLDFDEDKWKPLEAFLVHQKLPLDVLMLECSEIENERTYRTLVNFLENNLISRAGILKVSTFKMEASNEDQVMQILPRLDARCINEIKLKKIAQYAITTEEDPIMEINRIKELEHWKTAKIFGTRSFLLNATVKDLEHFDNVITRLDILRMSEVLRVKKILLESTIKEEFQFSFNHFAEDVDTDDYIQQIKEGERIPMNNEKILYIHMTTSWIYFKKIPARPIGRIIGINID